MTDHAATSTIAAEETPPEEVGSDSKSWATLTHLSGLILFFGIPSLFGPLVLWLVKRSDPFVDYNGKEALNFNISFLIYAIASAILIILLIGLLLLPAVLITWFVLLITAAVKASNGEYYRYPLTIRFVQ
jgi:uncharacterized Tic20 family protein